MSERGNSMNEKVMEFSKMLSVGEWISSTDLLEKLELEPSQKNFKQLKSVMLECGLFKAVSFRGRKGYRKVEAVDPATNDQNYNDVMFMKNLNRCIDYLTHMNLNVEVIANRVDGIISKFEKNNLFVTE